MNLWVCDLIIESPSVILLSLLLPVSCSPVWSLHLQQKSLEHLYYTDQLREACAEGFALPESNWCWHWLRAEGRLDWKCEDQQNGAPGYSWWYAFSLRGRVCCRYPGEPFESRKSCWRNITFCNVAKRHCWPIHPDFSRSLFLVSEANRQGSSNAMVIHLQSNR